MVETAFSTAQYAGAEPAGAARAAPASATPAPRRIEPRPLWREQVGDVLRSERREQGRILTEVAGTAGVSPQYLSEIERGRKEPSSEILGSVAGALGLGLGDIATRVAARLAPRESASVPHRTGTTAEAAGSHGMPSERAVLLLAA